LILRRFSHDAASDGFAFNLVAIEKRGSSPTRDHRREFPRKIDGVAKSGIHAEAARRTVLVYGIACKKSIAAPPCVGNDAAASPRKDRDKFIGDVGAHELPDDRGDIYTFWRNWMLPCVDAETP